MKHTQSDLSKAERFVRSYVQHYNEIRYWKRREKVVSWRHGWLTRLINTYRLFLIKRSDAFNNASMGTHLGYGATFKSPPLLPHGLYGIIISHRAVIGHDCTIFHQVTIGEGKGGAPIIGDNVLIGAGAKIIGNVHVGSGAKIGTNAVVIHDVPPNAVVVAPEGEILNK